MMPQRRIERHNDTRRIFRLRRQRCHSRHKWMWPGDFGQRLTPQTGGTPDLTAIKADGPSRVLGSTESGRVVPILSIAGIEAECQWKPQAEPPPASVRDCDSLLLLQQTALPFSTGGLRVWPELERQSRQSRAACRLWPEPMPLSTAALNP